MPCEKPATAVQKANLKHRGNIQLPNPATQMWGALVMLMISHILSCRHPPPLIPCQCGEWEHTMPCQWSGWAAGMCCREKCKQWMLWESKGCVAGQSKTFHAATSGVRSIMFFSGGTEAACFPTNHVGWHSCSNTRSFVCITSDKFIRLQTAWQVAPAPCASRARVQIFCWLWDMCQWSPAIKRNGVESMHCFPGWIASCRMLQCGQFLFCYWMPTAGQGYTEQAQGRGKYCQAMMLRWVHGVPRWKTTTAPSYTSSCCNIIWQQPTLTTGTDVAKRFMAPTMPLVLTMSWFLLVSCHMSAKFEFGIGVPFACSWLTALHSGTIAQWLLTFGTRSTLIKSFGAKMGLFEVGRSHPRL